MLKSGASRARAAIVVIAVIVMVGVWACATMRSGGRDGDGGSASTASTASTRTTTTAPTTTSPATAPVGAPLTITIKDLRNRKGDLIFGVFKSAPGFPNVEKKSIYWEVKPADAASVTFTTHLPPGRYAASVLHDENRSGDMDRGLGGIPLEGYGVTNNPKPLLRAATFDEATFTLPAEGKALTISLQYF
jgi:uncharacterized protein (DUF2141 family)